ENPSRISSHDMYTGNHGRIYHQYGAVTGALGAGRYKIEFVQDGEYVFSLRRFPRESGLAINEWFPEKEEEIRLESVMPASVKTDFEVAYLYVANVKKTVEIKPEQKEVIIKAWIPAGKYDLIAQLLDSEMKLHPAYYLYIEKL
ncbi:MAG: hypothetical protein R3182_09975, partial [Draconibacterium sp.]|nr:hypothetical protein [Draconibacterium sp.]